MHITLETDYAIRIVECLAVTGHKMDAAAISERTDVPQRFALKILRGLVHSDIIKSYKGVQGGYELAKPPAEITLRTVVEAVEGPYHFSRCLSEDYCCAHAAGGEDIICGCRFREVYDKISVMVRDELDKVNFAMEPVTQSRVK